HWNGRSWARVKAPDPGGPKVENSLVGVATTAGNVWAVGHTGKSSLIVRWNGSGWTRVPSPNPGSSSELFGVAAQSVGNAWAVGIFSDGGSQRTFAVHCC
ncbi:MAG TPA: hypothetical protein VF979_00335, partial [Streptosporangiaceae bacterium]